MPDPIEEAGALALVGVREQGVRLHCNLEISTHTIRCWSTKTRSSRFLLNLFRNESLEAIAAIITPQSVPDPANAPVADWVT